MTPSLSLESESLNGKSNINWLHTWFMQVQRVVFCEPLSSQLQNMLDMDILREWSKHSETSMITIWSGLEMNITHFEGRDGWRIWVPWVHWYWRWNSSAKPRFSTLYNHLWLSMGWLHSPLYQPIVAHSYMVYIRLSAALPVELCSSHQENQIQLIIDYGKFFVTNHFNMPEFM